MSFVRASRVDIDLIYLLVEMLFVEEHEAGVGLETRRLCGVYRDLAKQEA